MGALTSLVAPFKISMTVLLSGLTSAECISRIRSEIDPGYALFGGRAVLGRVGGDGFSLNKRIFYGNSFRTVVKARLIPAHPNRIECRCGMGAFPRLFLFFWFGFVALWTLLSFVFVGQALLFPTGDPGESYIFLFPIVGFAFFGFGWAFIRFCRYLARNEESFLLDFVASTLEARRA